MEQCISRKNASPMLFLLIVFIFCLTYMKAKKSSLLYRLSSIDRVSLMDLGSTDQHYRHNLGLSLTGKSPSQSVDTARLLSQSSLLQSRIKQGTGFILVLLLALHNKARTEFHQLKPELLYLHSVPGLGTSDSWVHFLLLW